MHWNISTNNLSNQPDLLHPLLEGQKRSLSRFGLNDIILKQDDLQINPGTLAIIATSAATGEMIAGVRTYVRSAMYGLPLEAPESYLPAAYRKHIQKEENICEFRGLWVAADFSGLALAHDIMRRALLHCYAQGVAAVVGTAQLRTYKHIGEPLGFTRDMNIPSFPFPDERFETIVAWHRKESMAMLTKESQQGNVLETV